MVYDAREISDRMEEICINEKEVELARSPMDTYNLIIKYQNEMMIKNHD